MEQTKYCGLRNLLKNRLKQERYNLGNRNIEILIIKVVKMSANAQIITIILFFWASSLRLMK